MEEIKEIEGMEGFYTINKVMIYKEIQTYSNFSMIEDYKGKIEIRKEK